MSDNNHSRGANARRPHAIRNPVARSPLLRKGGLHERAAGGKRHRVRVSTHEAIEEWLENREEAEAWESDNGEQQLPVFLIMVRQAPPYTPVLPYSS